MKKLIAVLIATAALTGCATSASGNYQEVDCTGIYTVKTFPVNDSYPVKINAVRENRFGEKYYRVSPSQKFVTFVNRWQNENKFEVVECE